MSSGFRRAVFLDRDGVLNKPIVRDGKPYPPTSIEDFEIFEDVPEAIATLQRFGFYLCVVTNQPDVARGIQSRTVVEAMHEILRERLGIHHFYVCWHDDDDRCECRKPRPGLLLQAAFEHNILLSESFMIGDRWRDVDCGNAAGCKTVFLDREYSEHLRQTPDVKCANLAGAVTCITASETESTVRRISKW